MSEHDQLRQIVTGLIETLHLEARELEKLVAHVEQVAGRLGYEHQFSVVSSELAELHRRIKHIRPGVASTD
jgi:hypothetical protein